MSESQRNELEKFVTDTLAVFAAHLDRLDFPVTPEIMARLFVDYLSSASFWDEKMKEEFARAILPVVENWYLN